MKNELAFLCVSLIIAATYGHQCEDRMSQYRCNNKIKKNPQFCETVNAKQRCQKTCDLCVGPLPLCPTGFLHHGGLGLCYKYVNDTANHSDAAAACTNMGAILAEPRSEEKYNAIVAIVSKLAVQPDQVWLGATGSERTFSWGSDGVHLRDTYTHWATGEPNNAGGNEQCVEYRPRMDGWNDWVCSKLGHYICQINSVSDLVADMAVTIQEQQSALAKLQQQVFFTAMNSEFVTLSADVTVVYKTVYTNVGDGYDNDTGVFTSPVAGYYQFTVHAMAEHDKHLALKLYQNGVPKFSVWVNSGFAYQTGSNSAILQLNKGDVIEVRAFQTTYLNAHEYNTFSGILLSVL